MYYRQIVSLKMFLLLIISVFVLCCCSDGTRFTLSDQSHSNESANKNILQWRKDKFCRYTKSEVGRFFNIEGSYINEQQAWISEGIGKVYRTNDGGQSWEKLNILNTAPEEFKNMMRDQVVKVLFVTANAGWLLGSYGDTWQTRDGGESWAKFPFKVSDIFFLDMANGWMIREAFDGKYLTVDSLKKLYKTQDGGRSWKACSDNLPKNFGLGNLSFQTTVYGWARAVTESSSEGHLIDGLAKTEDGGCKWKLVVSTESLDPDDKYAAFFFSRQGEGWLGGSYIGNLFHTTNNGKSWRKIDLPLPQLQIYSIFFVDKKNGWIIGSSTKTGVGGVFHTTDEGASWRKLAVKEYEFPANWNYGKLIQILHHPLN